MVKFRISLNLHNFKYLSEGKLSRQKANKILKFYKDYKGSMDRKSYRDLRTLYYSTKIVQFVNNVRSLINDNILWQSYVNRVELKTKY